MIGIIAGMRIYSGRTRYHLLKPRARPNMGQRGNNGDVRRIKPLIGHSNGDQNTWLCQQSKPRQHLMRIAFVAGGKLHRVALFARYPPPQRISIATRIMLIGGYHEQLA